jgi:hypothetical protein
MRTGQVEVLAAAFEGKQFNAPNDDPCASAGGIVLRVRLLTRNQPAVVVEQQSVGAVGVRPKYLMLPHFGIEAQDAVVGDVAEVDETIATLRGALVNATVVATVTSGSAWAAAAGCTFAC